MSEAPWLDFKKNEPLSTKGPWEDYKNLGEGDWEYKPKGLIESLFSKAPEQTTAQPLPEQNNGMQVSLPIIGTPTISGMAKGLYDSAKSAFTLPGDVYTGKVDPTGDEAIRRGLDFASIATPGSVGAKGSMITPKALSRQEIKDAATKGYKTVDSIADSVPVDTLKWTADNIKDDLEKEGYRKFNVPKTFRSVKELENSADKGSPSVGDLTSVRKSLNKAKMDFSESDAARRAIEGIDKYLDEISPDASKIIKTADANYAATMRDKAIGKIEEKAERDSRKGQSFDSSARNRVASLLNSDKKSIGYPPELLKQLEKVSEGTTVNKIARNLGRLSPTNFSPIPALAAGAGYAAVGGGLGAAIPPAIGMIAKAVANHSTRRQLGKASNLARELAPASRELSSLETRNPKNLRISAVINALMASQHEGAR